MKRIKIFLSNGYKYEGEQIEDAPSGFIGIIDSKDHKRRFFSLTAVQTMEDMF